MTDFLLQFVVGNVLVAVPLAVIACLVQRSQRVPTIAHVLWLLVLVKLITPPLLTLPVVPIPTTADTASTSTTTSFSAPLTNAESMPEVSNERASVVDRTAMAATAVPEGDGIRGLTAGLLLVWFAGAIFVLVRSLVPIVRFHRLMRSTCRAASPRVQRIADETARRLRMPACPAVETIPTQVAPLVWFFGGRVRVVFPEALAVGMGDREVQMVLAHELAHVKRCDHLVRWLEWLACAAFWWNPIAWWARRNLRLNEEVCCDAMVLEALGPDPRGYAESLLMVVEFLASPAIRPPAMACAMNGGGTLERRLGMIISQRARRAPGWLTAGVVALSMGLLPLGVAYAQDFDAVGKRLRQAVAEGEITGEQADAMMDTLRRSAARAAFGTRIREIEAAMAAGEMSREEGARAIEGLRTSRKESDRARDRGNGHEDDEARMRRIEAAVKAGKMSREEAAHAIEELAKSMREADRAGDRGSERAIRPDVDLRRFSALFAQAESNFRRAVEFGQLSPEEVEALLSDLRILIRLRSERHDRLFDDADFNEPPVEFFEGKEDDGEDEEDDRSDTRVDIDRAGGADRLYHRYAEIEGRIERAVESGELSREEAEEQLEEAHRELFGGENGVDRS